MNNARIYFTTKFGTVFLTLALILFNSCGYYKVRTEQIDGKNTTESVLVNHKKIKDYYTVVHIGNSTTELRNIYYHKDLDSFSALAVPIVPNSKYTKYYEKIKDKRTARIRLIDKTYANQLHIYVNSLAKDETNVGFKESDISLIELYTRNKGAEVATVSLVTAASLTVFLAITCNCPHVYTNNGSNYAYSHTLYTGTTHKVLERDDYKAFSDFQPSQSDLSLIIKNEENEEQHTNLLNLIAVQHDASENVYIDQEGKLYSTKTIIRPVKSVDGSGQSLEEKLHNPDQFSYDFNEQSDHAFSDVFLTFTTPADVENAQLIMSAKNHPWGGHVFNEFSALFGRQYPKWRASQATKTKVEIEENIKKQGFTLVVSIKVDGQWVDIQSTQMIGDVSFNTLAVPIPTNLLNQISSTIEVRIRAGFMLWQLDYVALSVNASSPSNVVVLTPSIAEDQDGNSSTVELAKDDQSYMVHGQAGTQSELKFTGIPIAKEGERTLFLHSKGYYLSNKTYEGNMQRMALRPFLQDEAFARFSKELYFKK
ncbi:MAG: hypothetical protein ACI8ZN_001509 [Bacteroidia bacterium]|jgi:hypothetical protein